MRRAAETGEQQRDRLAQSASYHREQRLYSNVIENAKKREKRRDPNKPLRDPTGYGPRILLEEYYLPEEHYLGKPLPCPDCQALNFGRQCCSKGQVHVRIPPPHPEVLASTLCKDDKESQEFRRYAVPTNSTFAFTCLSYQTLETKNCKPYMYLDGTIRAFLGSFRAPDGKIPAFAQLHAYDPNTAADLRMQNPVLGKMLNENLCRKLSKMFAENNYLSKQFACMNEILEIAKKQNIKRKNMIMIVRTATEAEIKAAEGHPKTLERPRVETASWYFRDDGSGGPPEAGVWVVEKQFNNRVRLIGWFSPEIDALCYPLINPYGLPGYVHGGVKLQSKGTKRPAVVETVEEEEEETMERRGRAYISDVSSEEGDSESDDDSIRSFPGRPSTSTAQQPPIHHLEDSDIEDDDDGEKKKEESELMNLS